MIGDGINADVSVDNATLKTVDRFMYLGSIQAANGGINANLKARLGKELNVFRDCNWFGLHVTSA